MTTGSQNYRGAGGLGQTAASSGESPGTVDQVKATAGQAVDQVTDKAGQMVDQAKEQAKPQVEGQKQRFAGGLGTAAGALRQTGQQLRDNDQENVAQYMDQVAERVEGFAGYLRDKPVDALIGDAERFARQQPALFLGAAFGVGLLAARFLKSSGQRGRPQSARPSSFGQMPQFRSSAPTGYRSGYQTGSTQTGLPRTGSTIRSEPAVPRTATTPPGPSRLGGDNGPNWSRTPVTGGSGEPPYGAPGRTPGVAEP
jgi:ElaB/YqjD/DUF883 family membrane-anchored ribosome-binding protein